MNGEPLSPFEKGKLDALAGRPAPSFPSPNSSWSDRLYAMGWEAGYRTKASTGSEDKQ